MINTLRRKKLLLLSLFFSISFTILGYSNFQENYLLKLEIKEKELPDKITICITLLSKSDVDLKVPQSGYIHIGYKDDQSSDCYFEIVEVTKSSEITVLPMSNYQYFFKKMRFDKIKKNQSRDYQFNITRFYSLENNKKYKIRLIFKLSKYNNTNDISSNWIDINT